MPSLENQGWTDLNKIESWNVLLCVLSRGKKAILTKIDNIATEVNASSKQDQFLICKTVSAESFYLTL